MSEVPLYISSLLFENNYLTEMCSGSEAGSYLRRIDFVYHSTLGLRVIKKRRRPVSCTGVARLDQDARNGVAEHQGHAPPLQGHLAYKKPNPHRTLQYAYA